jgi:hypothetical protein
MQRFPQFVLTDKIKKHIHLQDPFPMFQAKETISAKYIFYKHWKVKYQKINNYEFMCSKQVLR